MSKKQALKIHCFTFFSKIFSLFLSSNMCVWIKIVGNNQNYTNWPIEFCIRSKCTELNLSKSVSISIFLFRIFFILGGVKLFQINTAIFECDKREKNHDRQRLEFVYNSQSISQLITTVDEF